MSSHCRPVMLVLATLVLLLSTASVGHAAGAIVVNDLGDTTGSCSSTGTGTCTLRDAISFANANGDADTITFSLSGTITLTSTLPAISDNLTIDGAGQTIAVSGNHSVRVLSVNSGATLNLQNLTIANGLTPAYGNQLYRGGGIYNNGTLNVTNSTFSGNSGSSADNSTSYGVGIFNDGTLTVRNSTFSGNSGSGNLSSGSYGGGIFNNNTLTVTNSSFSGNSADYGGGIYNEIADRLTVSNSTFSGNSAGNWGGGISNADYGYLTVSNSTFSGNSAGCGINCGGYGGGIFSDGTLAVTNSTFSGNSSTVHGGGIYGAGDSSTTLENTIITSSTGENCFIAGGTYQGTLIANPHNLADDATCDHATQATSAQINLQSLADNGGPTQTMGLGTGSVAIDAGDNTVCTVAPVNNLDQRGYVRITTADSNCDIGAFEGNLPPSSVVETDSPFIQYDGWRGVQNANANGGSYRISNVTGNKAVYKFRGTSIAWVTLTGHDQGKAIVVIDGTSHTVDLYSAFPIWNVTKAYSGLANGTHTITIKVSGNKNAFSTGTNVAVDAFIVNNGTPLQANSPFIQYDKWIGKRNANASGGRYFFTASGAR